MIQSNQWGGEEKYFHHPGYYWLFIIFKKVEEYLRAIPPRQEKKIKQGTNPLFPTSDGKGLKGAYEQAALMDDNAKTFKKEPPASDVSPEVLEDLQRLLLGKK